MSVGTFLPAGCPQLKGSLVARFWKLQHHLRSHGGVLRERISPPGICNILLVPSWDCKRVEKSFLFFPPPPLPPPEVLTHCRRSWQADSCLNFWLSVKTFRMSIEQIFRITKSYVIVVYTVTLSMPIVSVNSELNKYISHCHHFLMSMAVQCKICPPHSLNHLRRACAI